MKTTIDINLPKKRIKSTSFELITSNDDNEKTGIHSGYGRCKACDCKGYISKHNDSHECKNCGHHYDRHYSA